MRYLFQGDPLAQGIVEEIRGALGTRHFDCIRIHVITQMIQHHGKLLETLVSLLTEKGFCLSSTQMTI